MPFILALLLVLGTVAPAAAQASGAVRSGPSGMVWGQVRSEKTGAPLRFAVIEVVAGGQSITAATDSNGVYVLRQVPPGRRLLRAMHFDHAPNEVEILVAADKQHVIDFDLEFRPVRLNAVTAEGARGLPQAVDTVPAEPSALGPANVRALESTPGVAELGLREAARDVPGHEPVDPSDVLYVRGGAADLKLVLLNGAPVYAPFHIGGLIEALDGSVLRGATLYSGGAPARFDGGLSYVMDLETRSARTPRLRGELGVDLLSARTVLEGPVGSRGSLLVGGRSVHGAGTSAFRDVAFPYDYADAVARADFVVATSHTLSVTGFWNDERVRLDSIDFHPHTASWGNRAGSLRYRGQSGDHEIMATASHGRFRTRLPLIGGIVPLVTQARATRSRLALDVERPFAGGRVFWGGSYDRIEFDHRTFPQGLSADSTLVQTGTRGDIGGLYGEAAYTLMPRLRVRLGMRADVFSEGEGIHLAPRGSATLLLTQKASLTLSAGQFRQYVRTPQKSLVFVGDVVPDSADGALLTVAEATHVVLGLSQEFDGGVELGVEGFFKQFDGLQTLRTMQTASSGLDLWLRSTGGEVSGWLGYSLAWVWSVENSVLRPASRNFSGRHLVSAGVLGPIFAGTTFDVRVAYGAGLPYTAIPEPETASPVFTVGSARPRPATLSENPGAPTFSPEPQDPYFRVDAQVSRAFGAEVAGFDFMFTPYLRVLNALNRRDAIFYHYNRDIGQPLPLADLPVVPIVGMEWKF